MCDAFGDAVPCAVSRRTARWLTQAHPQTPVYLYHFTHELEAVKLFQPNEGVSYIYLSPQLRPSFIRVIGVIGVIGVIRVISLGFT